ncbi:hypothetical protein QYF36_012452 [Acer negundo]|nr:hypothetical protein QYF36_012452 [Acer negundo]
MTLFSLSNLLSSLSIVPLPSPPNLAALSIPASLQLSRTTVTGLAPLVTTRVPKISADGDTTSVVWPSLANANIFNFFNVQIKVGDEEPEEIILNRFRRSVLRAGILQESKRRRFFESNQDKRKRKARAAAQRNRKRRPLPKTLAKHEYPKNKDDIEDDNWEVPEGDIPYCKF